MHRAFRHTWAGMLFFITLILSNSAVAAEPFPEFEVIQPNVAFWTKVYTQYSSQQAIVHDSHRLGIIYEVVDLKKPYDAPGMRKINRKRMKRIKAKYRRILTQLADNPQIKDRECRRVAELFGPDAGRKTFRIASQRIRSQIGQRDRFRAGLIRSGAYIDEIRTIFKSYDLPVTLSYLPHVESSFNLKAYSKFGAAGIWQFTRSTGRRFMKVNYVLDERRDPIKATHAAAQLLKENYAKLQSWPLAITAYNHGAAGMQRARKAHGRYPEIFKHYKGRTFKFASRNFYAEFLAASQIAENYTHYFGELDLDEPKTHQTVVLDGYVRFEDICHHFNVAPKAAASINPALRPPVFNGQKHIPKNYAFRLPGHLELNRNIMSSIPKDLYHDRQKASRFYTVQRGDTAGKIARRHNVKLSSLILANNLNRRATIYPKQTLRIPLPGQNLAAKPKPAQRNPEVAAVTVKKAPESKPVIPTPKPEAYPQPVLASVIPSPAPKAAEERMGADASETAEPPSAEVVAADVRFSKILLNANPPVGILQVEVEETLGHYADWAGVRTQRIRRLNRLAFGKTLHLHQEVRIPIDQVSAEKFEESRYEFHKRLQEDFFAVYRTSDLIPYRIERGDNYWTLCREKFEVPMWLLQNSNPEVDFSTIRANQKIWVPVVEKISDDNTEPPQVYEGMHLSNLRLQPTNGPLL